MILSWPELPIVPLLPELDQALASHQTAILMAPPGSGKSTLVPLALAHAPWLAGQKIVMLEPRRLAARAVARRMAALLGEEVGERVGYQVRFDRRISHRTTLEVVTEGLLTRRLQHDPGLTGVGLVIFDEFHERSLQADLGLALCLDLLTLRQDLRLLVMSATLTPEPLSRLMQQAPVVTGEGRLHPVAILYQEPSPGIKLPHAMARTIQQALADHPGDILAFLPGSGEIRATRGLLHRVLPADIDVIPLYGHLTREEQDQAMSPPPAGHRRVILSTDIAESSLTLPGIRQVVDGGFCRRPRFHAGSGLTRLDTLRIAKSSADQRAGRAGRLGPGRCIRLWSPAIQEGLLAATPPEILEADLAPLLLELALWGVNRVEALSWLDEPPAGAVQQARALLQELQALDAQGRVTEQGRAMAAWPLHPRLSHMILTAATASEKGLACDLAALLSERNPWPGGSADIQDRLQQLALCRRQGATGDPGLGRRLEQASRQCRQLAGIGQHEPGHGDVGLLLAAAFPDRVAQQRPGSPNRYRLANGRGVRLAEGDPLASQNWLVVAELDAGDVEGRIYQAVGLREETLRQHLVHRMTQTSVIAWDQRLERVVAQEVLRLGSLVLETRPLPNPDGDQVREALCGAVSRLGWNLLDWTDETRTLQARMHLLRQYHPEGHWPDWSDEALLASLSHWLSPHLTGITRREQLARLEVPAMLRQTLAWSQNQRLEEGAPSHWQAPSGSRLRLAYALAEPPILAVRMQELFGLADTPTLCWGRVPVTLHLLSPANRAVQVTRDLRGFWDRTWPEVRKELLGRYPKHFWPEDPWTARPTSRSKPRR